MGLPKPMLPFGPELLLQRVVRRLGQAVEPVLVVASRRAGTASIAGRGPHRPRPPEGLGPMEGFIAGLSALGPESEAAFVVGCDVPMLVPAFVTAHDPLLGDYAMAVPVSEGYLQPLAAVYRREVAQTAARLLAAGERCPLALFDALPDSSGARLRASRRGS